MAAEVAQATGKRKPSASKKYSQKYLAQLMTHIDQAFEALDRRHGLRQNMTMWGVGTKQIDVWFKWNTPEMRQAFSRLISDSPAIVFHGRMQLNKDTAVGVCEVDSVAIWAEYPIYSNHVDSVNILLTNCRTTM